MGLGALKSNCIFVFSVLGILVINFKMPPPLQQPLLCSSKFSGDKWLIFYERHPSDMRKRLLSATSLAQNQLFSASFPAGFFDSYFTEERLRCVRAFRSVFCRNFALVRK